MYNCLQLCCIDPALGRLDYESLSDQALMEMLVDKLHPRQKTMLQDAHGNYKDACEWTEVRCMDGLVDKIFLGYSCFTDKHFCFELVPPLTKSLSVTEMQLEGTLDTANLPLGLHYFSVSGNKLEGPIDFQKFPRELQEIRLSANAFTGSITIADFPDTLVDFHASGNHFSGELSLNDLPTGMKNFDVRNNDLMGSLHIDHLPPTLRLLDLAENSFSGDFRLLEIPPNLDFISTRKNLLSGKIVLGETSDPAAFHFESITAIVDTNGEKHKLEDAMKHMW